MLDNRDRFVRNHVIPMAARHARQVSAVGYRVGQRDEPPTGIRTYCVARMPKAIAMETFLELSRFMSDRVRAVIVTAHHHDRGIAWPTSCRDRISLISDLCEFEDVLVHDPWSGCIILDQTVPSRQIHFLTNKLIFVYGDNDLMTEMIDYFEHQCRLPHLAADPLVLDAFPGLVSNPRLFQRFQALAHVMRAHKPRGAPG